MSEFLFFLIGLLVGGCVAFVVLCCLQINRINALESEIRRLRSQPPKEPRVNVKLD